MSKIFVGSLPWKVDSALLRERFEQYGQVEQAIVLTDRETGRSRGFGFVTYTNAEDAQRAIDEANDSELEGRTIRVASAAERDPNSAPPRRPFNNNRGYQQREGGYNRGYQQRSNYGGNQGGYQQRSYDNQGGEEY